MDTKKSCVTILLIMTTFFVACGTASKPQTIIKEVIVERDYTRQVPGAVEYVWEEPMTDVIDVPPGLDPEGHYYRPAHQSIVEVRQGRWKYQQAKP
ncbi:MAG: hypothetical protein KDD56_06010 [Bdellovibrionales bacterium]|nr:hypothetical protein [Bdellovibrionales bacterium]